MKFWIACISKLEKVFNITILKLAKYCKIRCRVNYFVRTTVGRQFIGLRMNLGYVGVRFFRKGLVGRTFTIVKFLGEKTILGF